MTSADPVQVGFVASLSRPGGNLTGVASLGTGTNRKRLQLLHELLPNVFWSGLSLVWSRLGSRPAFVFILLSFAFGSAISVVVPPLRGPDEIAHFLRIYSYARGGLLPVTEVDGRKGIFIEHELYTRLSFFKNAGERFGQNRQQGLRYGAIMQEYSRPAGTLHEQEHAAKFMPFAGTEG